MVRIVAIWILLRVIEVWIISHVLECAWTVDEFIEPLHVPVFFLRPFATLGIAVVRVLDREPLRVVRRRRITSGIRKQADSVHIRQRIPPRPPPERRVELPRLGGGANTYRDQGGCQHNKMSK
jgi:hypothetical protein